MAVMEDENSLCIADSNRQGSEGVENDDDTEHRKPDGYPRILQRMVL